jgi:hypothetical protein
MEMEDLQAQEAAARQGAIGAAAPPPSKPFSTQAIKGLIDEFNKTLDKLGGEDLPDVEWEPPTKESKWPNPLPQEIFAPMVALTEALKQIGGGAFATKYDLDPMALVDDTTVRKATAVLRKLAGDKDLAKAMQEPAQAAPAGPPPAPASPTEFTEEDQELMGAM